jgi:hypothetical protein
MKILTLKIPKGCVPQSYFWPKKALADFRSSIFFCACMGIAMSIMEHTIQFLYFYVASLVVYGLVLLWAKWRASVSGWKHLIEANGIWAEPVDTWRWPKKQFVLPFEKVEIQSVEDSFYRGEHYLRINFSWKAFRGYEVLDLPYLHEDKDVVQIQLIPFLNTKITETATRTSDETGVRLRSRVSEPGWNWDGYSEVAITLATPPAIAPLRYLGLSAEMGGLIWFLCLTSMPVSSLFISQGHWFLSFVLLAVMIIMDWSAIKCLLWIKRSEWTQHIEDKGIWVESAKTLFSKPKGIIVLDFGKHQISAVETISKGGTNFVRIHYKYLMLPLPLALDLPYLPKDSEVVEDELIPYLRSKITQTAVQGTA